jgi:hypothetical protein
MGVAGCWLLNGSKETEQNGLVQGENRQNSLQTIPVQVMAFVLLRKDKLQLCGHYKAEFIGDSTPKSDVSPFECMKFN